MPRFRIAFFICFLLIFSKSDLFGSHLRGGQITFQLIDCTSNTYDVIVTLYINTLSPVEAGGGILNFGDGTTSKISFTFISTIDSINAVGEVTYVTRHTFGRGGFTVNYTEPDRNAGVANIPNSSSVPFSIESFILVDGQCNQSIIFSIPPIDRACSGFLFSHNPGIIAPTEDSVSYELVKPLQGIDSPVNGYQDPTAPTFYSGNYQQSNEERNGPPVIKISETGTLTWDAPGITGEYTVDIKVTQWKRVDSGWIVSEWVIRDMQILVLSCDIARPYLSLPPDVCVHPGDNIHEVIRGYEPDQDPVTIESFTVDDFKSSAPQFINVNKLQSTAAPNDTANIKVNWLIVCDHVRAQPYKFIFKISSVNKDGVRAFSYQTWQVKVVGVAPVYQSVQLNVSKKTLDIQWQPYPCNIQAVDVYRRVDHGAENPSQCQPGIQRGWGYSKIGSSNTGRFTDEHLAPGATYCYRLVARFPSTQGLSIVSKDTCIGPIVIDAPVITNVSVSKTDKKAGAIFIRWLSPIEINRSLFPPPYQYTVQRTTDSLNYITVTKNKLSDTTWIDSPRDVVDSLFGYRVIVYSPTSIAGSNPIDTSALSFYPRLDFEPINNGVRLSWNASVPWSNQTPKYPWHYIYRKEVGSTVFSLMDSIDVDTLTLKGFYYTDLGKKSDFPINQNTIYVYKVETQGAYGNPKIDEPLQNFSNEVTAQAFDKTPPCAPQLTVQTISCDVLINSSPCISTDLKNTAEWTYPINCGNDVAYYKIFFAASAASGAVFLDSTTELKYVHSSLNSLAGCYQVSAVDRSGNSGALSQKFCVENCTNVYLPNIITVNGDGLNETFPDLIDKSGKRESIKCPRFVKSVSMQIFNRWGEEVFTTEGSPGVAEWKGLDKTGRELSAGVYFYSANVYFYTLEPEKQTQHFNGIVNLIR